MYYVHIKKESGIFFIFIWFLKIDFLFNRNMLSMPNPFPVQSVKLYIHSSSHYLNVMTIECLVFTCFPALFLASFSLPLNRKKLYK